MPPLVWALGFANPLLLYGLAAAGGSGGHSSFESCKYRESPLGGDAVPVAAIRKNRRRLRIEQWLLLAIRTLIILLVVAAMAKPFSNRLGPSSPVERTHKVIVIDGRSRWVIDRPRTSRFDQAKAVANQIVKVA